LALCRDCHSTIQEGHVTPHDGTQNLHVGPPVGTVEVRLAAEFIERFGRAKSDDAIWSAWHETCSWSGFRDHPDRPPGSGLDPAVAWRWLARVSRVAKAEDDVVLPSRILGCALFWDRRAWQYAQVRDFAAVVQLPTAERDIKIRLAATALSCLLVLPAESTVVDGQAGPYTASGLAMYAVNIILGYSEGHSLPADPQLTSVITPELAALARDVWAGRVSHARWT
jgi:hypothetical protein